MARVHLMPMDMGGAIERVGARADQKERVWEHRATSL
jgi:hypothetical protein